MNYWQNHGGQNHDFATNDFAQSRSVLIEREETR
jgi:hypothetical protein